MSTLRGLSLWNPHAGLMAVGAKGCETRPRTFGHRGPLAIQATKGIAAKHRAHPEAMMQYASFRKALNPHGWFTLDDMPRGAIVALVWVDTETVITGDLMRATIAQAYGPDELKFGWYEDGRVVIHTDRAKLIRVDPPVECAGAQGLWTVPAPVLGMLAAQVREHPNFRHYVNAFGALAGTRDRWHGIQQQQHEQHPAPAPAAPPAQAPEPHEG